MKRPDQQFKKWMISLPLSSQLTIILMLFLIIPTFLICVVLFDRMRISLETRQKIVAKEMLSQNNQYLEHSLALYQQLCHGLVGVITPEDFSFTNTIQSITESNPDILQVRVFLNRSDFFPKEPILYNRSQMIQQPWYSEIPLKNGVSLFSSVLPFPTEDPTSSKVGYVTLLEPLYQEDQFYGMIEMTLPFEAFFPSMKQSSEDAWVCFVNASGLLYYDKENTPLLWHNMMGSIVYSGTTMQPGLSSSILQIGRHSVLVSTKSVPSLSGKFILGISMNAELLQLKQYQFFLYTGVLLLFFVCATVVNRTIRYLLKRLEQLTSIAQEVSRGNLGVTVPDIGKDEIGQFAMALRHTIISIQALLAKSVSREVLVKTTELRALQSQINAHFIYNVLESIKMLAEMDEHYTISDAITALGELLRYSMRWTNELVPLEDELHYIEAYVALQNLRYDFFVTLSIQIPPHFYRYKVPKMSLQPLVENAMIHGIEGKGKDALIAIRLKQLEQDFEISVIDTGTGMTMEEIQMLEKNFFGQTKSHLAKKGGIGLCNVAERIHLYFGPSYGLRFVSKPGFYTKAIVRLPLSEERTYEKSCHCGG